MRNMSTDLPDVGELVARIILDPRTLNKSVFISGDAPTLNEMGQLYERVTGRKLTWTKASVVWGWRASLKILTVYPQ